MIHIRTPIYVYTNKSPNLEGTIQVSHQGQTSHPGVESHRRGGGGGGGGGRGGG